MEPTATVPTIPSSQSQKSNASFRLVFLLLLVVVLLIAVATTYILTQKNTFTAVNQNDNPFAELTTTNPFIDSTDTTSVNPFNDTGDENPFSAFDTVEPSPATTGNYQNPF